MNHNRDLKLETCFLALFFELELDFMSKDVERLRASYDCVIIRTSKKTLQVMRYIYNVNEFYLFFKSNTKLVFGYSIQPRLLNKLLQNFQITQGIACVRNDRFIDKRSHKVIYLLGYQFLDNDFSYSDKGVSNLKL